MLDTGNADEDGDGVDDLSVSRCRREIALDVASCSGLFTSRLA